jgi:hypothetical protein
VTLDLDAEALRQVLQHLGDGLAELDPVLVGVGHQRALEAGVHVEPEHVQDQHDGGQPELAGLQHDIEKLRLGEALVQLAQESKLRLVGLDRARLLQLLRGDRAPLQELQKDRDPLLLPRHQARGRRRFNPG